MRRPSRGFTLVELLVVIGIIALLISILLPALGAARRQANAVKCSSALREMGNAFKLYALDNKDYYPPANINMAAGVTYELNGVKYPITTPGGSVIGALYYDFLAKYVTKGKVGIQNTQDAQAQADARKTILWGCPAFDGYNNVYSATSFDVNPTQPGYCMNGYPTNQPDYPIGSSNATSTPPQAERSYDFAWTPTSKGSFQKATIWGKHGAERMLVADGKIWFGWSGYVSTTTGGVPRTNKNVPTQYGELNLDVQSNETGISLWRHSRLPASEGKDSSGRPFYNPNKSKLAYNILYCDGHVATEIDPVKAYLATRMKYPR